MVFRVGCGCLRNLVIVTCHLLGRWSNAFTHLTFQTRINSGILWFCAISYFCIDGKGDCYVAHCIAFFPLSAALTKMQTLSCNNIVGIVYLIWYTSEQITCIFCTIYACKRIAIPKCQQKNREKEVKGEKGK